MPASKKNPSMRRRQEVASPDPRRDLWCLGFNLNVRIYQALWVTGIHGVVSTEAERDLGKKGGWFGGRKDGPFRLS